jgi:hypothetical protein
MPFVMPPLTPSAVQPQSHEACQPIVFPFPARTPRPVAYTNVRCSVGAAITRPRTPPPSTSGR